MITRYERMIARRYLLPGRGEAFIFLVASISLVAVALGVAALVAVMSVMNGFRAELFDRILGMNGHAVVQGYDGRISDWPQMLAQVRATPGVTQATPIIEQPTIMSFRNRSEGVILRGMYWQDLAKDKMLARTVRAGDLRALSEPQEPVVALGSQLAVAMGAQVGDTVSLVSPGGEVTPFGTVPRIMPYRVAAIIEVGIYDYDKALVVMPIEGAQDFLRMGDDIGMITVRTTSADKVDSLLAPLKAQLQGRAVIVNWRELNGTLFEALSVERTMMFVVVGFIILVAVFNILTSLIMLVRAKTKDIAILRTMGAPRAAMLRIFMTIGTLIGGAGIVLGLALGFTFLYFRQNIVEGISKLTGVNLWDPSIRYLTELPSRTDALEVLAITGFALILSFLATLYPAWKAASTDPVEVLRYE